MRPLQISTFRRLWHRRREAICLLAGALVMFAVQAEAAKGEPASRPVPATAAAGLKEAADEHPEITPAVREAMNRGLEYLARHQEEDGSFRGSRGGNTGIVSFAVLSFLAGGHLPKEGQYGDAIVRSIEFVLRHVQPSGLISNPQDTSNGPMYEHAMSTLLLAEIIGEYKHPGLLDTLNRAVNLIVTSQNRQGGWRYLPGSQDADVSVTVMQVVALRAARGAGLKVPDATMRAAARYVRSCATPGGGFLYQPGVGEPGYARTASGVCALLSMGLHDASEVLKGLRYLQENKSPQRRGKIYTYYGLYYAAQAMYLAADRRQWLEWYPPIRDELLGLQQPDGHWDGEAGPLYGTEMAILALSVPLRSLPVYQRELGD